MTNIHHAIDYVELNVGGSLAESRAFYEQAFGWGFNDYGPDYAGIRAADGDGEVGGLNGTTEASGGGPLVLLYSDDLDVTLAAVREAGGAVVEGPYEFPGGRRFHFTDPAGNVLGVWASS
ncbi:glyoxalase [Nocardioides sp. Root1257]|uniref:VOC family protein n=1 Tax=unclassified Nocardioides TaxID=2615069 RepID=UPI0006F967A3|nr:MULTISPECIES: VOC family protein [unclassified Nocardioides]KQW52855.1 glyoxalase [Nocardioides sp. Root1257]KRC55543.1 glyoxalase [Nocardioides sp. Root224]